jgi:hypothetical protein
MREVIGRVEPEENKKLPFVEAKHLEGHVGGEMMYHTLFRDGYYWPEMRGQCHPDIHTRYVLLRVLRLKAAEEVAEALIKIFVDFGSPKILQSDNDLAFLNKAMDEMKSKFGFKNRSTIPYFP